jgi:ABC-type iron transport system FetAB ATPase subunit
LSRLRIEGLRFHDIGPIELAIEPRECICISGPSGSGKTLMLRSIADLDPHEGRIFLDAREACEFPAPEWRRRVGLLPSESRWWRDTVRPHLPDPPSGWLETLGLGEEALDWPVSRLSAGERQRIALLRLLCNRPEVLLLDEPTARLDPDIVQRTERLISDFREQSEAAVIWISHDPAQIERIARRHYRIESGLLQEVGAR